MGDFSPSPVSGSTSPMTPKSKSRSFLHSPSNSPINNYPTSVTPPRTPSPPPENGMPLPLRYPETLGPVIVIRETEGKGLGVLASRDVPVGTILLSESPLITLIDTGTRSDPLTTLVSSLPADQQASFLSLHSYSSNPNQSLHRSIVYSNGYAIGATMMATGVFETASRINHSCVPNSSYTWKENTGRMVFYNRYKLMEGEEVTVNYGHKRGQLKRIYGFECQCGGCTEWGSVQSVDSGSSRDGGSSRGASDNGEREMANLDKIVKDSVDEGKKVDELEKKIKGIVLE